MSLPVYSTGTVSVAAGDTVVTLAGGMWSGTNVKQGDFISIANSAAMLITEVTDASHLKIAPWPGAAQTAAAYQIFQNYVGRVVGVAAAEDVGVMLEKLHTDGLPFIVGSTETAPDPSYGDEGQLAFKPSTGQWWIKSGGAWVPSYGLSAIGYGGTSATSVLIGLSPPTKVFTTQAQLAYNGARVRAASAANLNNFMEGVASYSGTTLTMTADTVSGAGTFADWLFSIAGQKGATGPAGPTGASGGTFPDAPSDAVLYGRKSVSVGGQIAWAAVPIPPATAQVFRPEDFGGGAAVANNATAFQNLAAAVRAAGGGVIQLQPNKTYVVYPSDPAAGFYTLMDLSNTNGVVFDSNGATISCPSLGFSNAGDITITVLYFKNATNYFINGLRLAQPNYPTQSLLRGFIAVQNHNTVINALICNLTMIGGRAGLWNTRDQGLAFSSLGHGLTLLNADFQNVGYPLSFQKNMNNFVGRGIKSRGAYRCYFPYNVCQHDVQIESDASGAGQDCMINNSYDASESLPHNTISNIKLDYVCRPNDPGWTAPNAFTCISFQTGGGSTEGKAIIRNIDLRVNIDNQVANTPTTVLTILNQTTTPKNRILENVHLTGSYSVYATTAGNWLDLFNDKDWTGDQVVNFAVENFDISSASSNLAILMDGRAVNGPLVFRNISQADGANSSFVGTNMANANRFIVAENVPWSKGLQTAGTGLGRVSVFGAQLTIPPTGTNGLSVKGSSTSGVVTFIDFADSAFSQCGAINCDQGAHTTSYQTSSDARAKPNRELMTVAAAIDVLSRLTIWDFDKDGNHIRGVGVLAQEAYEVLPRMVMKGDDNPDLQPGDEGYVGWSAESSYPVPYLIVALQEALRRITTLETMAAGK